MAFFNIENEMRKLINACKLLSLCGFGKLTEIALQCNLALGFSLFIFATIKSSIAPEDSCVI